nr:MAG TPA: hypothetical protein [Caudoviricetes sp.]
MSVFFAGQIRRHPALHSHFLFCHKDFICSFDFYAV